MSNRKDQSNLKRVIVDFKKLTPEILALLVEKYPDGYDDDQIISFRKLDEETVRFSYGFVESEFLCEIFLWTHG